MSWFIWSITSIRARPIRVTISPPAQNTKLGELPAIQTQLWTVRELKTLRGEIEDAGLVLAAIENLDPAHWHDILLDGPQRPQQIEKVKTIIRRLGEAGIPVLGYNFSLAGVCGRVTAPLGRGHAITLGMDGPAEDVPIPNGMIWNMIYDRNAPAGTLPSISHEELWRRLQRFLEEVIPVAEESGVQLAAHPDDPPMPTMRQQPRLVYQPHMYQRLIDLAPSRSNALELCVGTLAEMTEGNIYDAVDQYSKQGKIAYIHLRNVVGKVPHYRETFIDEGDVDMIRILAILHRNGFDGVLIPDHTPQMTCSAPWHAGMAHTLGFMLAAKAVIESPQRCGSDLAHPRMEATSLKTVSGPAYSRGPLVIAATVSTLGGLLFGYDNIVISGAIGYLSRLFHLDAAGMGWAAGCALVGCIAGCAAAGTVADYLGKKKGLALCALCFALSSVGMMFAARSSSVCFLAADWRSGHRCGIRDFSELHCRDCSHAGSRPLRDSLSTRDRGRNSCRRLRQHADSAHGRRSVECIHGLALDVFRRSRARNSVRIDDPAGGRKSALADENGPARSGPRCACQNQWPRGCQAVKLLKLRIRWPVKRATSRNSSPPSGARCCWASCWRGCNRSAASRRYFLSCRRFFAPPEPRPVTHSSSPCW